GLAHRDRGQPEHVAGFVRDVEALAAEEMADGVDRPGDVVQEEHADEAAPEQRAQGGAEAASDDPSDGERDREANQDPDAEHAVDQAEPGVADEVRRKALPISGAHGLEQPADVGVPQALDTSPEPRTGEMWGMGVAFPVREGM